MAKEAFYRNISLLTSKLNIELRKKLSIKCGALRCMARRSDTKKIEADVFGQLRNVVMEEN